MIVKKKHKEKKDNSMKPSGIRLEELTFGEVVKGNGSVYQILRQWDGSSVRAADKRDQRWRCQLRYQDGEIVAEGAPSRGS